MDTENSRRWIITLDEIYCGPMDDVTVGVVLAYGERKGEIVYGTVKARDLLSGSPTVETKCRHSGTSECGQWSYCVYPDCTK